MTTWLPRWIALLLLVVPFVTVVAVAPDDKDIERLVRQLGSDQFTEREEATKRLMEIGEPALDALQKVATSDDLEVRRRAKSVIAAIEEKLNGEQLRLTGHTSRVFCVCVSADGKRVPAGSDDKTLRLWDADSGECLRVFEGHTEAVLGAAISPDGKRVLSGSFDKTVRLWDATTGKELRKYEGHTSSVNSVAFGPEGKALSGSIDGTLRLWDLNTGKRGGVFSHSGSLDIIAYSDQAKLAATSSQVNQTIYLWNLETGKEVRKITKPDEVGGQRDYFNIMSLCFSADGKQLLAAQEHEESSLRIWDVQTGKDVKQIMAHEPRVTSAAFSPDGKRIVSGGADGVVRLWDVETSKELRTYEAHTDAVDCVAFFPDGKRIVSAGSDGTARIWAVRK